MQTTARGFKKAETTDNADLTVFINDNMDKLETELDLLDVDLTQYNRDVTVVDGSGYATTITYTRPSPTSTLFMTRVYSNADAYGNYQTCVETYKAVNGTTTTKTYTFALTFLATTNTIDTMSRTVS